MALGDKKKKEAAAATDKTNIKTGPEFDESGAEKTAGAGGDDDPGLSDDDVDGAATIVDEEEAPAAEAALPATQAGAGAVAKAGKPVLALAEQENAMPIIDFGVLPLFTGNNGGMYDNDDNTIGSEITVELLSWRHKYVITPNEDSDEARELVKYSDDGVTVADTQQSVADYIAELKGKGYDGATSKDYVELTCMLEESNQPDKAAAYLDNMVQISLAPQSRKAFEAHRLQMMVKLRMKKIDAVPTRMKVTGVPSSWGTNKYTKLVCSEA